MTPNFSVAMFENDLIEWDFNSLQNLAQPQRTVSDNSVVQIVSSNKIPGVGVKASKLFWSVNCPHWAFEKIDIIAFII